MIKKILGGIFLVAIIIVSGCVEQESPVKSEPQAKVSENPAKVTETEPPTTQTQETPKEKIYSMNENVNVDYLTYKATKAETFTEMGTSFANKKTNGKFVKVYLDITNNAQETKQIFTPRFKIIDNQDRQFDRLSDDMMYIADYLEFGKQLQPSLTTSGAIVFELPKDSEDLKLIIRGDWTSIKEVKIDLSSIKNVGKDTTQEDKQNKIVTEITGNAQKITNDLVKQSNEQLEIITEETTQTNAVEDSSKYKALLDCYKKSKECSEGIPAVQLELMQGCKDIYMYTSDSKELIDFTSGMC